MEKYKELIDFAERIRAKGVPEQQYIAEGIFELVQDAKCKGEKDNPSVGQADTHSEGGTTIPQSATQTAPFTQGGLRDGETITAELYTREALNGSIVEEANGDRWIVEGWVYEAKELQDDFDREMRLRAARRTFTQDELDRGVFRVIAKAVS